MSETIYAALFERMARASWIQPGQTVAAPFVTMTRRVVMFDQVSAENQPWCAQAEYGQDNSQISGMPYKEILEAHWLVYFCLGKDFSSIPTIEANKIVDAIKAALAPIPTDVGFADERNTLGNLVHHCFIKGRIFKEPGDIDGQGLILVPIRILVP